MSIHTLGKEKGLLRGVPTLVETLLGLLHPSPHSDFISDCVFLPILQRRKLQLIRC